MALIRRYTATINGAMTFTGNTLGFGELNQIYNDIGAFITLDSTLQVSGYPVGSTLDWRKNASLAYLNLPAGSEVVYAELIWGGSTKSSKEDVTAEINSSVGLLDSTANPQMISPDPVTAQTVTHENQVYYIRTADITTIVKDAGSGAYIVSGVPGTVQHTSRGNAAGWTLAVIYKNTALSLRNMNLYAGIASISGAGVIDQTVNGFATPESAPFQARALLTAIEGDSFIPKDQFLFGSTPSTLQVISGPNNLADNFFASQINDDQGNLDISGTAGTNNVVPGQKQSANRYGWDITNVDVSAAMTTSQTQATARLATRGDGYVISGFGLQIDINSPEIKIDKQVDHDVAMVGDILTYTILIENSGLVTADKSVFTDHLPSGLAFVTGSLQVDGITRPSADPSKGVDIGTVSIEGPVEIIFHAEVVAVPPTGIVENTGILDYEFQSAPGLPILNGSSGSNAAYTTIKHVQIDAVKTEDQSIYDQVGDIITYSVQVTNNGDTAVSEVVLTDAIPLGTALVPGSVLVDGKPATGSLDSGIPVGILLPDQTTVLTFQVVVQDPLPQKVENQANVDYQFQLKPGGEVLQETEKTNIITAVIETACQKAQNQVFESVAQQELALARILKAESNKVQQAIKAFEAGQITAAELAQINQSVERVTQKVDSLEKVLQEKLEVAKTLCCE